MNENQPLKTLTTALTDRRYTYAIVIGVAIAAVILTLWYLQVEPFHGYMIPFMAGVQDTAVVVAQKVQDGVAGIGKLFVENPWQAGTVTLAAVGSVYGIVSKIRADHLTAKTQVEAAKQVSDAQKQVILAGQQYEAAQVKIDSMSKELETYKSDNALGEAQKLLTEKTDRVRELETTVRTLEDTIKQLKLTEKTVVA